MKASAVGDQELLRRTNGTHLAMVSSVIFAAPLVTFVAGLSPWISAALLVYSAADRRFNFWNSQLIGQGRSHATFSVIVASRLPPLCIAALPKLSDEAITLSFILLSIAGTIIGSTWSRLKVGGPSLSGATFDPSTVRMAHSYWMASIGQQSRQLDLPLLGLFAGVGIAALYAPASRLLGPMKIVSTSIGAAAFPQAASQHHSAVRRVVKVSSLAAVPAALCTPVIWLAGEGLFQRILGQEYSAAWPVVCLLLAGVAASLPGTVALAALQGYGVVRFTARFEWCSAAAHLLLVVTLGHSFGANQAATGALAVSILGGAIPVWRLHRHLHSIRA